MNFISSILTASALANYNKAKEEYEQAAAEDNTQAICAAIAQYNDTKYHPLDQFDHKYQTMESSDFLAIPLLNVGMMVGDKCRMEAIFILKNVSQYVYKIKRLEVQFKLYGKELAKIHLKTDGQVITINPGSYLEWDFLPNGGIKNNFVGLFSRALAKSMSDVYPMTDELKKVRTAVREANSRGSHVPPISSCSQTSLVGNPPILTCDVFFQALRDELNNMQEGKVDIKDAPGTVTYKGEAFYPYKKYK